MLNFYFLFFCRMSDCQWGTWAFLKNLVADVKKLLCGSPLRSLLSLFTFFFFLSLQKWNKTFSSAAFCIFLQVYFCYNQVYNHLLYFVDISGQMIVYTPCYKAVIQLSVLSILSIFIYLLFIYLYLSWFS